MTLSHRDINALKGVSIVLIVLHNVTHWLSGVTGNEFTFSQDNLDAFVELFMTAPITALLSFLGWLGVPLFIFASGYGLSLRYASRPVKPLSWIGRHYIKLFLLLLPALAAYVFFIAWRMPISAREWINFGLEQTLFMNVIEPSSFNPGAYWYLGMALQLYLWFPVLSRLSNRRLVFVAAVCLLMTGLLPDETVYWLRRNSIGWLPEFVFGILMCRKVEWLDLLRRHKMTVWILALVLIVAFSMCKATFMLTGLFCTSILLTIAKSLGRGTVVAWLGAISAGIYVLHPVVRSVWFVAVRKYDISLSPVASALLVLSVTIVVALPYTLYYNLLRKFCDTFTGVRKSE